MSDETQELRLSLGDLFSLLNDVRDAASNNGKAHAYRDVLESARERLADKEAELVRIARADAPHEQMVMGEIMALRCLVSDFEGAPDHYGSEASDYTRRVARQLVKLGIAGDRGRTIAAILDAVRQAEKRHAPSVTGDNA